LMAGIGFIPVDFFLRCQAIRESPPVSLGNQLHSTPSLPFEVPVIISHELARASFPEEHKPLLGGSLAKCRRDAQSMRRKKSSGWWYNLASSSTSTKSNRLSPDSAFATNDYGRRKCPAKSDCVSPASMRVYSCRRNGVFGTPARLSAAANGKGSVTGPSSIAQLASR
jgi:hypothetical protein